MHQFIDGTTILPQIKSMLNAADRIDLAVAFWGRGAIDRLGITTEKPTRILCDALSGGCNPSELRALFEKGKTSSSFEVRHLRKLHAKVYLTPNTVIVGSANASTNGLGEEGDVGTIEAAIASKSDTVIKETFAWFQTKWDAATEIDDDLLKEAERAYKRTFPGRADERTVLETLFDNPSWFRNRVRLIAIVGDANSEAISAFEEFGRRQFAKEELAKFDEIDFDPYYQNDAPLPEVGDLVQAGDYVLDFCDGSDLTISRLRPNPFIAFGKDDSITLVEPRRDVLGRKFPLAEQTAVRKAVEEYLAETGTQRDDFGFYLDELPAQLLQFVRKHYDASLARKARKTN